MTFTVEDLQNLSNLAKIDLDCGLDLDFKAHIKADLEKIILFINNIAEADTQGITPMNFTETDISSQYLRDDLVSVPDQKQKLQKNAPKTEAGLYLVPPVIEETLG